jgi:hypothetical protein
MQEQIENQQVSSKKIPWWQNLKWYHLLLISIGLSVVYYYNGGYIFYFGAFIGYIITIIQAIRSRKKK